VGEPINLRQEGSDLSEVDWDRTIRHLVNPAPPRGDRNTAQMWLSIWDPARWGVFIPAIFGIGLIAATVRRSPPVLMIGVIALAPQLLGAAMAGWTLRFRYPFDPLISIVAWYGFVSVAVALISLARRRRTGTAAVSAPRTEGVHF
jgi:hypothetical protein